MKDKNNTHMPNNLNKLQEERVNIVIDYIDKYFVPKKESEVENLDRDMLVGIFKACQEEAYNQGVKDSVEALFKIEIEQDSSDYELAQLRYRKEAITKLNQLIQK